MNGFRLPSARATLRTMASFLWRALVAVHRYLGIAVGLVMLMWFCSGIVMMYVDWGVSVAFSGFPSLADTAKSY